MCGNARFLEGTGRKTGLNVGKWSFSQGLSGEFSRLSLTHQNTLLDTFSYQIHPPLTLKTKKKTPKKLKNCIFGQISNSSLIFYPLPILGLSFEFYYAPPPPIRSLSKLDEAKFRFQNQCLSKVNEEKP